MDKIVINLSDPQVLSTLTFLALLWGTAVGMVMYSLFSDISEMRRSRKPKRERRFIEPCAKDMHEPDYAGTTCVTCKQDIEPQPTP